MIYQYVMEYEWDLMGWRNDGWRNDGFLAFAELPRGFFSMESHHGTHGTGKSRSAGEPVLFWMTEGLNTAHFWGKSNRKWDMINTEYNDPGKLWDNYGIYELFLDAVVVIFGKILLMRYGMITATIAGMVALGMHLVIGCVADPQSWLVRDGFWLVPH